MKLLSVLLASILFFTACDNKSSSDSDTTMSTHTYHLTDTKGKEYIVTRQGRDISVQGYEGKVVIFDIFATWCPGCKVIAPHLGNLQKKYKDDVLILGISIDNDTSNEKLDAFSEEHNAHYPISNAKDNRILAQRLAYDVKQPRAFGIPLVLMYDKNKKYFIHYLGPVAEEIIDRDIQSALGKK